jgi:hypothetical protein
MHGMASYLAQAAQTVRGMEPNLGDTAVTCAPV